MALDAELLSLKSAGTYRFERDLSTISNDTTTFTNLRLVVGFSKIGPFNTVNLVTSPGNFIKLYGNIDRSLEKKGSYFHRSALVALSAGTPILCLNLLSLDPDRDKVNEKSLSVNTYDVNKYTIELPLQSIFNTDKFWVADGESFLDSINTYLDRGVGNEIGETDFANGVLHFTNISKKPMSILVKKASAYNTKGYELTVGEWFGEENVPEYLNRTSYVSDYMVEVYIVGGNFGPDLINGGTLTGFDMDDDGNDESLNYFKESEEPYKRFSSDIVYQSYFDEEGFIRKNNVNDTTDTKLNAFLSLPSVNLMGKYVGSLIPNFTDKLGRNIWIQKLINDDIDSIGLVCAENVELIEGVNTENEYINETIDIVGHNIFNKITQTDANNINKNGNINLLSYKMNLINPEQKIIVNGFAYGRNYYGNKYGSLNPFAWTLLDECDSDSDNVPIVLYTRQDYFTKSLVGKANVYISEDNESPYQLNGVDCKVDEIIGDKKPLITSYTVESSDDVFYDRKKLDTSDSKSPEQKEIVVRENECILNDDCDIKVGDYILSYNSESDECYSRLTRVVRTSYVYNEKNNKYLKISCVDKIYTSAGDILDNTIIKVTPIDKYCDHLQWIYLAGFKINENSIPNGTNDRQDEILDMLREYPKYSNTVSNLFNTLKDRDYIQWRYLVDTFGLGIEEESKSVYTKLCMARQSALAIINCPSQRDFKTSIDPSFVNKSGGVEAEYIANGGNLDKSPAFLYSLPSEENGATYGAYYYPYLRISDLSAVKSVPPAAYVSNLFIQKYNRSNAWAIVAGQKRGVISGNQVIGVESTLVHENRDWLEPKGINSIIWENGVGVEVYSNKTAKQSPKSALSSIHVRECCIYIQDNVESILRRYVFEYNTEQTRLEIKTLVDDFLETVKSRDGIYAYRTVMDTSNNNQEVIDNNMGIIDIFIEPVRGLEMLAQRLTVMKTGGIEASSFD